MSGAATPARDGVVHLVDDDPHVRRSGALLLGAQGYAVMTYESGEEMLAALDDGRIRPGDGCAVLDILMPGGMDGLALQLELSRRRAGLPVVIVTGHGDVALAVGAMKAGAVDFLEKPYEARQLRDAVAAALGASPEWRSAAALSARARLALLSPREAEVLAGMVAGRANKVIAHDLGISQRTVETHRAQLMDRLGVRSLAEAIRLALAAESSDAVSEAWFG